MNKQTPEVYYNIYTGNYHPFTSISIDRPPIQEDDTEASDEDIDSALFNELKPELDHIIDGQGKLCTVWLEVSIHIYITKYK